MNKKRISTKPKRIKTSFWKAVDSGCKSGGRWIAFGLYNECYGRTALHLKKIFYKFLNKLHTPHHTRARTSISPFEDADDEENNDVKTENTCQRSTVKDMGEFRRNLIKHLRQSAQTFVAISVPHATGQTFVGHLSAFVAG